MFFGYLGIISTKKKKEKERKKKKKERDQACLKL